jgi:hypothetical protein
MEPGLLDIAAEHKAVSGSGRKDFLGKGNTEAILKKGAVRPGAADDSGMVQGVFEKGLMDVVSAFTGRKGKKIGIRHLGRGRGKNRRTQKVAF